MFHLNKRIKKLNKLWFLTLLLVLSACQTNPDSVSMNDQKQIITVATGGTTGPYFAIANKMTELFDQNIPNTASSVRSSGGGVENIQLILEGKAELGLVMADTASFVYEEELDIGLDNRKELRAVAALYPNYVHIITLKGSGIHTVDDLLGKKVGVGDVGSGTEVNARTILHAFGITYEEIEEYHLSYKESVIELKNGNVDAAFLTSGLPNAMILELKKSHEVEFIAVSKEKVEEIAVEHPYYYSGFIPENTYQNDKPIPTAVITNLLLTRKDLPEELIYQITNTIFANLEQLHQAHHAAVDIRLETAQKGLTVPLHSGAKRFYEEHRDHVLNLQ